MYFSDKTLTCKDCGENFLFTAGEQDFYRQKGLQNEPGRCHDCRNRRKQQALTNNSTAQQAAAPATPTSATTQQPIVIREVSKVVCAECGKETTVPFRPRLARPVYCSECLHKQRTTEAPAEAVTQS